MISKTLVEATREEKLSVHSSISISSPGRDANGEEKNQDRLMSFVTADGENTMRHFAIVCDGVTPSPCAAAAAEYVSSQVRALFQEGGFRQVSVALKEMRRSLFEQQAKTGVASYQTTFVAVCIERDATKPAAKTSVKTIGCGDTALFIFRENGELCYNNMNLSDEEDRFRHDSSSVAVLPDCYDEESGHALPGFEGYAEDVQLLLCSDGFYDGFTNFKEIRGWLNEHRAELTDSALREKCLSELHGNLRRKKEDDDISFIWLRPGETTPPVEPTAST